LLYSETSVQNIVSLLRSAGQAVASLGKKESQSDGDTAMSDSNDQSKIFQDSMNDFIRTLRAVNVGMKRQIWGLEEARIVTLRKEDGTAETQGNTNHHTALEPDGDGKIGGLDAGWLNSRSNKVERHMEAELWEQAEAFLQRMLPQEDENQMAS
jgi:hypothetical protein